MKSAFVAIVGRPSSGKSTLINALCAHKVSIVSSIPQTTRNRVRGIVTVQGQGQVVFLDTPGFHLSDRKFNLAMMENVTQSLNDADMVVYLLDASRKPADEELALIAKLKTCAKPLVIALNKMDLAELYTQEIEACIQRNLTPKGIVRLCALKREGLQELLSLLLQEAPEGEAYYPEDYYTDQETHFRVAEIVREQVINRVNEELPYAIYVKVTDMEVQKKSSSLGQKKEVLWLRCTIMVERESQIGILVGKEGKKIKEIRVSSQKELGKIFSQRIHLDLRVKVHKKWRTQDQLIQALVNNQ